MEGSARKYTGVNSICIILYKTNTIGESKYVKVPANLVLIKTIKTQNKFFASGNIHFIFKQKQLLKGVLVNQFFRTIKTDGILLMWLGHENP